MLFKFLKRTETSLHKRQSIWSIFKKAYLKSKNFKKYWLNLDKQNLPKNLIEITDFFTELILGFLVPVIPITDT